MEINIVDTADYGLAPIYRQLFNLNQDPIRITNGPEGVKRMVDEIISKAKTPQSIDVLRIFSHGNSGVIVVTGGDRDVHESSEISIWGLPKLEMVLLRLTPYFKPTGRVELLGCYVATHLDEKTDNHSIKENSDGERLLKELAKIWKVRVLASGNTDKGLPIAGIKFIGLVVQATPDGGLSCMPAPPEITKIN